MYTERRFTILGCGSSGGVPRLGGQWGACDPDEPRNHRRRCSLLIEQDGPEGTTRVLVDSSPDLRMQLLDAGVGALDGVIYTHAHADHVHGLDDLRMVVFNTRTRLPVWADAATRADLLTRFGYAFEKPLGSNYPPILDMNDMPEGAFAVPGAGGAVPFLPLRVVHGSIDALGFRIGDLAYLPDVSEIYPDTWPLLEGLDTWILDALRYEPHPTHAHLDLSLSWLQRSGAARGILTNMHFDIDYHTVDAQTPSHIVPAHDGMVITVRPQ